ncbi:hypothetical protein AB852_30365 [Streptomyces uncialis]|uniref:HTH luxR-type domain-containing protein n=1 Tax=Streptomyces uncialis TaxID=1048205 RepID=A0A1Q4V0F5_9ACTN|nr:hypothetical protein AB852_30365 [Streptomyces uncialis]
MILAEDSTLLREGLVRLLAEEGHEVLAAVGDAVALLAKGRAAFDPEVVRQLLGGSPHADLLGRLTAREKEVLAEMAQGHTNAAIAGRLHISQSAVEKHINAIFDKLELSGESGYSRRVLAVLRYLGT